MLNIIRYHPYNDSTHQVLELYAPDKSYLRYRLTKLMKTNIIMQYGLYYIPPTTYKDFSLDYHSEEGLPYVKATWIYDRARNPVLIDREHEYVDIIHQLETNNGKSWEYSIETNKGIRVLVQPEIDEIKSMSDMSDVISITKLKLLDIYFDRKYGVHIPHGDEHITIYQNYKKYKSYQDFHKSMCECYMDRYLTKLDEQIYDYILHETCVKDKDEPKLT
jgi:hypothetical protein